MSLPKETYELIANYLTNMDEVKQTISILWESTKYCLESFRWINDGSEVF